jgi:hypothetical protein
VERGESGIPLTSDLQTILDRRFLARGDCVHLFQCILDLFLYFPVVVLFVNVAFWGGGGVALFLALFNLARPRPFMKFCNKLIIYAEELVAPCLTPKLEDTPAGFRKPHNEELHNLYSSSSTTYNWNDQDKKGEMSRPCSMNGVEEECM